MIRIDYSLNVNPLGVPKTFKKKMQKSYKNLSLRHDMAKVGALDAISAYHGVSDKNLTLGSGTSELLYLALKCLKPVRTLVVFPSPPLYAKACRESGSDVVPCFLNKENDFDLDFETFKKSAQVGVDMVILANPNNPTSRIIPKNLLLKILDYCQEKGIYVVIDEAYADFVSVDISAVKYISKYANVIILRTLSNYFALKGLRFSYAISCESLTELLHKNQFPGTVGYLPLIAFETLFRDFKYIKKTKAWLLSEPKRFYYMVSTLGGVNAYKPFANFIFIELEQIPSAIFCERMANKGISVCNCNSFGGLDGQYIRISIKDRKSNEKFLEKFSSCLL
ncbi:MAG: histidinol-phosphate transaminase [Eubacteriales bacterium]|nr:histidinol-phosphate transaminase [Eubacteriales bacterium]